jgi:heme-degrading monooxygenase HmoA
MKGGEMAIQIFIKRICEDPSRERERFNLVRKIRLVPLQSGYLSSKYVKKTGHPKVIVAISTWDSIEYWQNWFRSEELQEIQSKIDAIPSVKTTYETYEDTTSK